MKAYAFLNQLISKALLCPAFCLLLCLRGVFEGPLEADQYGVSHWISVKLTWAKYLAQSKFMTCALPMLFLERTAFFSIGKALATCNSQSLDTPKCLKYAYTCTVSLACRGHKGPSYYRWGYFGPPTSVIASSHGLYCQFCWVDPWSPGRISLTGLHKVSSICTTNLDAIIHLVKISCSGQNSCKTWLTWPVRGACTGSVLGTNFILSPLHCFVMLSGCYRDKGWVGIPVDISGSRISPGIFWGLANDRAVLTL